MKYLSDIWVFPRATIAAIVAQRPLYLFYPLSAVYWAVHSMHLVLRLGGENEILAPAIAVVAANIGFGVFCGPLLFILVSYPVHWSCRILGGTGNPKSVRIALAWSSVPYAPLFAVLVPIMLIGPTDQILQSGQPYIQSLSGLGIWGMVHGAYQLFRGVMIIWGIAIALAGISEVEGISKAKVFLANIFVLMALSGVVFIVGFIVGSVQ